MKKLFLTTFFATQLIGYCFGAVAPLPEIPAPKLSAADALAIAQRHESKSTHNLVLVAVNWCKPSVFQPSFSDGTTYSPGNDHPDEYSWFVTYVYTDEHMAEFNRKMGLKEKSRFNSVLVIRIKDDGQVGSFVGVRT